MYLLAIGRGDVVHHAWIQLVMKILQESKYCSSHTYTVELKVAILYIKLLNFEKKNERKARSRVVLHPFKYANGVKME